MKIENIQISNFRSFPEVTDATQPIRLEDFSILVGKNNSGKSNIFRAIRFFYREDDYKSGVTDEDFFATDTSKADELWVEVTFAGFSDEELDGLTEKYVLPDKMLRVRRTALRKDVAGKGTPGFLNAYELSDGTVQLSSNKFQGFDEVGLSKLGDVLHIPTVKDLPDELKGASTSGSIFAKMMKAIIEPAVLQMKAFDELQKQLQKLELELRGSPQQTQTAAIPSTLSEIEAKLSEALSDWQTRVSIKFSGIPASDIVSRVAGMKVVEGAKPEIFPESMGHGPQRYLLFAMIRLWAEVEKYRETAKKKQETKEAKLALLLYEEPELYLDPHQQHKLAEHLMLLSQESGAQILISTHSPYVVPSEHEDFRRIVRLEKADGVSLVRQASGSFVSAASSGEYKDEFRFALWLNADRKSAYFAEWVVLAEGYEEKVALNYLAEQWDTPTPRPVVLDCGGKKQIPKFMKLLNEMGIRHRVISDDDTHMDSNDPRLEDSQKWGKEIVDSKNEFTLGEPIFVSKTLPIYLMGEDYRKITRDMCKPLELLKWLEQNTLEDEKRKFVEGILAPPT